MAEKAMSKTDRNALSRLVKQRFSLMRQQLESRGDHVDRIVRDREMEAAEQRIEKAKKLMAPLEEAARKLNIEIAKAEAKLSSLKVDSMGTNGELVGVERGGRVYVTEKFAPAGLGNLIMRARDAHWHDRHAAMLRLRELENELLEDLLVGGLEEEGARKFLDRIPTMETLLPLPTLNGGESRMLEEGGV